MKVLVIAAQCCLGCLSALFVIIAACASRPATPPRHVPREPRTALEPALLEEPRDLGPPAQVWMREHGELLVGSIDGLIGYSLRGTGKRVISPGPALYPRWYGPQRMVVVRPRVVSEFPELRDGASVELVSLADGTRRRLLDLPPIECAGRGGGDTTAYGLSEQPHFALQDPADFVVDPQRQVACLQLMDAGWNTATMRLEARMTLNTGALQRWVTIGLEGCGLPEDVQRGRAPADAFCPSAPAPPVTEPDPSAFAYTFAHGCVRSRTGAPPVCIAGYHVERISGSQRWLLLAGDVTEGDYVYRRFVLLDRLNGDLYAVPELTGIKLVLLAPPSPSDSNAPVVLPTPIESAALWPGETDVRFLSDGQGGELLVVDHLVIRPGQSMFEIEGGSIAR